MWAAHTASSLVNLLSTKNLRVEFQNKFYVGNGIMFAPVTFKGRERIDPGKME